MSKEKVIEYVMNSPHNTNRAVLEGLLDDISGEEWATLFEEEATTAEAERLPEGAYGSELNYNNFISANTIKVTFDGVEYECNAVEYDSVYLYGAAVDEGNIDFSEYPFVFNSDPNGNNSIITSTPGVHTIKVETSGDSSSDWSVAEVTFYNDALSKVYAVECAQVQNGVLIDIITIPEARQGEVAGSIIPGNAIAHIPIYGNGYFLDNEYIHNADYTSCTYSDNIARTITDDFLIQGSGSITLTGTQSESN